MIPNVHANVVGIFFFFFHLLVSLRPHHQWPEPTDSLLIKDFVCPGIGDVATVHDCDIGKHQGTAKPSTARLVFPNWHIRVHWLFGDTRMPGAGPLEVRLATP